LVNIGPIVKNISNKAIPPSLKLPCGTANDYGKLMRALSWWNALPEVTKIEIWEDLGGIADAMDYS